MYRHQSESRTDIVGIRNVHWCSIEIGGDDNEPAGNDTLDFTGFCVALTLFDSPREDDVFEIENGEVFIF